MSTKIKVILLVACTLLIVAVIGWTNAPESAPSAATQAPQDATDFPSPSPPVATATPDPWPPMVGDIYVLGSNAEKTLCSDDLDALNSALDAADKNDTDGYDQALAGNSLVLTSGTHVLILNYDVFKGVLDMRVRTGVNAGARAYCETGTDDDNFIAKHA